MTLYLDASALVKRYVAEDGSDVLEQALARADALSICRVGFVEAGRAIGLAGEPRDLGKLEAEWGWFDVVDVDQALAASASSLSLSHRLRTLDALHLAAALRLEDENLVFATWDRRLHRAALAEGLAVVPEALD